MDPTDAATAELGGSRLVDETTRHPERGSGLIGMMFGLTVFLLLLIFAVQVLFNLYANTALTSAAHEATRQVAGFDSADDRCAAVDDAETAFWERLGNYADSGTATLTWTCNRDDVVRLTVEARHPTILPAVIGDLSGLGRFNRTIEMHAEAPQ